MSFLLEIVQECMDYQQQPAILYELGLDVVVVMDTACHKYSK